MRHLTAKQNFYAKIFSTNLKITAAFRKLACFNNEKRVLMELLQSQVPDEKQGVFSLGKKFCMHKTNQLCIRASTVTMKPYFVKQSNFYLTAAFWRSFKVYNVMGVCIALGSLLASHPAAPGLIPGTPKNVSLDTAEIYRQHCLEQWTEA